MITTENLLKLKEEVTEAKNTVLELNGQQTALLKQLKDIWKCSSIEEAEKKLKKLKNEIVSLEEQIEKGVEEIEENYEL